MRDRSRGIVSTDGHYRATTRTPVSFSVPQHRPQRGGLWLVGSSKSEKFILNPIPRAKLQRHLHVQPPSPNGVMARKERRGEERSLQYNSRQRSLDSSHVFRCAKLAMHITRSHRLSKHGAHTQAAERCAAAAVVNVCSQQHSLHGRGRAGERERTESERASESEERGQLLQRG